ncbi:MAG: rod shape-determining protein MreD [Alphaproteobacteria bacterium]|nr:MAG: rod shape-determining protein MreD [Alphaproteobacteria bacterium]
MADPRAGRRVACRLLFLGIVAAEVFFRLLPLGEAGGARMPGPDIMFATVAAWSFRRPEYVPAALVATAALVSDFLLMRPPGLWAAILVLASAYLKTQRRWVREASFLAEWARFGILFMTALLARQAALWVTFSDVPDPGRVLALGAATVAVYPLVVLVSTMVLGIRTTGGGDADAPRLA